MTSMTSNRRLWLQSTMRAALVVTMGSAAMAPALAQDYPNRAIRLVVPAFVGTPVDILARVVAAQLGAELGQTVFVDNKPSAGGIVGAQEVRKQPADGYTLMNVFMPMSVAQTILRQANYDLRRDFVPVGQTLFSYNVLVVPPSLPATSLGELVALLKSQPGKLNFASGGVGSPAHLSGELLNDQAGARGTHVPYNAFPQAIADLLAGQVQYMFAATAPVVGHIAAGKLRALAVTGTQRVAALPDVPTMAELGFPQFVVRDWQGLMAREGTPPAVVDRLNTALRKVVASPAFRDSVARLGADPASGTAADFGRLVASEVDAWARLAKAADIRAD